MSSPGGLFVTGELCGPVFPVWQAIANFWCDPRLVAGVCRAWAMLMAIRCSRGTIPREQPFFYARQKNTPRPAGSRSWPLDFGILAFDWRSSNGLLKRPTRLEQDLFAVQAFIAPRLRVLAPGHTGSGHSPILGSA